VLANFIAAEDEDEEEKIEDFVYEDAIADIADVEEEA